MSKRFSNLHLKIKSKKPKLDVSVVSGQCSQQLSELGNQRLGDLQPKPATTCGNDPALNCLDDDNDDIIILSSPSETSEASAWHTPVVKPASRLADLWGEDDDEIIMLASQAVEQFEACSQQVVRCNTQTEFSLSLIHREAKTSTQIVQIPDIPLTSALTNEFTELNETIEQIDKHINDYIDQQAKIMNTQEPILAPSMLRSSTSQSSQPRIRRSENRMDLIKELKFNMLANKLKASETENDKLKNEINHSNEKYQTKDGEVSMLRYQLNNIKLVADNLRLEKIQENDLMKREWIEKVSELEKIIKQQKSELSFKELEIINAKNRGLNASQRLHEPVKADISNELRQLVTVFRLHMPFEELHTNPLDHIEPELFQPTNPSNVSETKISEYLRDLLTVLAQIQSFKEKENSYFRLHSQHIYKNVIGGILEIQKYADQLEFSQYTDQLSNPKMEYNFLCRKYKTIGVQSAEAKAPLATKFLRALAYISQYSKKFSNELLTGPKNECFAEIFVEVLQTIGFSQEVFDHSEFINAGGKLLNSLARHATDDKTNQMLIKITKSLIFCRPNYIALTEISDFLAANAATPNGIERINLLCHNSPSKTFFVHEYYKILQFSDDSCTLQVYGALLEVAFPQHTIFGTRDCAVLLHLTRNTIQMFRNCLHWRSSWIITDSEKRRNTCCYCYNKLANTTIVLLHLCLKQWMARPKTTDLKTIASLARIGILFLYDLLQTNFHKEVLRFGGNAIKNRLQIVIDLFHEHRRSFGFRVAHDQCLQSIDLCLIISDSLKTNEEDVQLSIDLGNQVWDQTIQSFFD